MSKAGLLVFAAVSMMTTLASATVCVYEDSGFRGQRMCWQGWERGTNNLDGTGLNDKISSIEITAGETVTVCEDSEFRGQCRTYQGNQYNLDGDFNDRISSVGIAQGGGWNPPPPRQDNDICFYTDAGFRGQSFCMSRFDRGTANLDNTGFNDKISSIRVPPGVVITVFRDANYSGDRRVYSGDQINLDGDFNDVISSILIENRGGWGRR